MPHIIGDTVKFGDRYCTVIPFDMADRRKAGFKNSITDKQINDFWTFVECDQDFTEGAPLRTFLSNRELQGEFQMNPSAAAAAGGRRKGKSKTRKNRKSKGRKSKSRRNI